MSEQDRGWGVGTISHYYHFCAKQVFPDSHAQTRNLYLTLGARLKHSKKQVQQQQVKDAVLLKKAKRKQTITQFGEKQYKYMSRMTA